MRLLFRDRRGRRPARHIADVEIVFDAAEPALDGLKVVGLSLWRSVLGGFAVTLPARKIRRSDGPARYYDLLRSANGSVDRVTHLKGQIIAAYQDRFERNRAGDFEARRKTDEQGKTCNETGSRLTS